MWGMTVSLADIADGYVEVDKGLVSAVKGKRLARLARRGKVAGVYGQGQAEAAEDAFAQVRRQQARASMQAKTGAGASQNAAVNTAGVRVGQYGTGQKEAAEDAFKQARKQKAKASLDRRLTTANVADQMERWGDEGARGVVRRRRNVALVGGGAVAAAGGVGGGGYAGYKQWDSRRKEPVGKGFFGGAKRVVPLTRKQQAGELGRMWVRQAETSWYKRRPPVPGLKYNSDLSRMSEARQFALRARPSGPVGKSFDEGYVSKVSLKPVWQATKQAAKKVGGGVKGGWQSGKPAQPFKEMNSPVAAGKALGSQVGAAAKGGWGQLSQAQKYGGLAAAGTGALGTGVGYGASQFRKADDGGRRSGWRSDSAIGGALASGSAVGLALTPRDFREAKRRTGLSRQWSAIEESERARAGKWYRTPRGRKKILRTADDAHLVAARHALAGKSKRIGAVASVGLGAAGVAQGGRMLYRDRVARRSGD